MKIKKFWIIYFLLVLIIGINTGILIHEAINNKSIEKEIEITGIQYSLSNNASRAETKDMLKTKYKKSTEIDKAMKYLDNIISWDETARKRAEQLKNKGKNEEEIIDILKEEKFTDNQINVAIQSIKK